MTSETINPTISGGLGSDSDGCPHPGVPGRATHPGDVTRTQVMGIVNVTPDSFSDGGCWADPQAALDHARALIDAGADLIDIGGESTRPGSTPVSEEEELRRILPVVAGLRDSGVPLSIDTMHARVAREAVENGAKIVNDVSGGLADGRMLPTVAELISQDPAVRYVCMHWRYPVPAADPGAAGDGDSMPTVVSSYHLSRDAHDDVVAEVIADLGRGIQACLDAGIPRAAIIVDPGIGFDKTPDQDWELLRNLDLIHDAFQMPMLVGVSRKKMFGQVLQGRPPLGRDGATAAVTGYCASKLVWAVRTHEVANNADVTRVYQWLNQAPRIGGATVSHLTRH